MERFNKELQDRLRVLQIEEETTNWVSLLSKAVLQHNTHPVRPHRKSPFELMYGVHARLEIDPEARTLESPHSLYELGKFQNYREEGLHCLRGLRRKAMKARRERYRVEYGNTTQGQVHPSFRPGDVVLRINHRRKNKLAPHWDGPFIIYAVSPSGAYQLQAMDGYVLHNLENQKHLKLALPPHHKRWQNEGARERRIYANRIRRRRRAPRDSRELVM